MTDLQSDLYEACGNQNGIDASNYYQIANSTDGLLGKPNNYFIDIWNDMNRDLGLSLPWDYVPCSEIACCISYLGGNANKILVSNYAEGMYNLYRNASRVGNTPQLGAFVWFQYGSNVPEHTGRVMGFDNDYIYTVEGNVGGIVVAQMYPRNSPYIYAYGYPYYTGQTVNPYVIRSKSPKDENLIFYNTPSSNGINTCGIGNSVDGFGISGADALNNDSGYSQGRMNEMYYDMNGQSSGNYFSQFIGDTKEWINIATNNNIPTGSTPKEGAVGIWSNGVVGHSANIESYNDNTWWISHSSYYDYADLTPTSWIQGSINSNGQNAGSTTRVRTGYINFDSYDAIILSFPVGYRGYVCEYQTASQTTFVQRFPDGTGYYGSNSRVVNQKIPITRGCYYRIVLYKFASGNFLPTDALNVGFKMIGEGGYGWWDFSYLHSAPDYLPDFIANDNSWHLVGFIYPFDNVSPTPVPPTPPPNIPVKSKLWLMLRNPYLY